MLFRKLTSCIVPEYILNNTSHVRSLARWTTRSPIKVIPTEEYNEKEDSQIKRKPPLKWDENHFNNKSQHVQPNVKPLTISRRTQVPKITMDMLETTIDEDGNFIYTKMKNNDTRITTILSEIKSSREKDIMLLEGKRLIKDALDAKCKVEYILFSRVNELEYIRSSVPKINAKLYKMPYRELQMWSNLTTSPGIMGIFKIPDTSTYKPKNALPLTVICDNIREADNLGAVLRICSGVGCAEVLLTKGCVNVWDSKVLRSACGAHFKLRIHKKFEWEKLEEFVPSDSNIYIADNNVISLTSLVENADKTALSNLMESIPVIPYYGAKFNHTKHNVLIVGGETEGISEHSYKLASSLNGTRLNIPLGNNVESLNVGTALGVIIFEIKRQYLIANANKENEEK